MIIALWACAGVALAGLAAVIGWGLASAAAAEEFERELRAWTLGGDVITAIRRDVYARSGRLATMTAPVQHQAR